MQVGVHEDVDGLFVAEDEAVLKKGACKEHGTGGAVGRKARMACSSNVQGGLPCDETTVGALYVKMKSVTGGDGWIALPRRMREGL